jgi:tetratricopeptide (TPR) repeat protein
MEINSTADLVFSSTTTTLAQLDSIAAGALGRGIDAFTAGDYGTAVREFRRAAALSPYSENAYNAMDYMATAQVKDGKAADAEKTYKQAIKAFPAADGFHLSYGHLLFSEGRYEEAVEHYAKAVKLNPTDSNNRYSLGQGYLALANYDDAEAQFKQVIRMQPKDSGGYYALGQTYRLEGNLEDAQVQLDRALTLKEDFAYAHYELGMLYAEQHQTSLAQEELGIISEELPDSAEKLQNKIYENSAPRVISAYTNTLNLASTAGTEVVSLDSSLATAEATKNFTVNFIFDKDMDIASVQNIANWGISRSTSYRTGGPYNWGIPTPATEIATPQQPAYVIYDPDTLTAKVTFTIAQNASGDGTIDLSHLVFKFNGLDSYGNAMDESADEYNVFSAIV